MKPHTHRALTVGLFPRAGLAGVLALSASLCAVPGVFARGAGPGGASGEPLSVKDKDTEKSKETAKEEKKSEAKDSAADKDNGKGNDDKSGKGNDKGAKDSELDHDNGKGNDGKVAKAKKSKSAPCSKCKGGKSESKKKCKVCKKKVCADSCACHGGGGGGSYGSDENYEAGSLGIDPADADAEGTIEPSPGDPVAYWRFDETSGVEVADHAGIQKGTLAGGAATGEKGASVRTFRMDLDGENDWMSTASALPWFSGTFSVSYWVKTTAEGDDDVAVAPALIGHDDSDNSRDLVFGYIDLNGGVAAKVGSGAAVHSQTVVNDGQWHHVVLTRDAASGRVQVFVDGALEQAKIGVTGTVSSPVVGLGRVKSTLSTASVDENTYFDGSISEVKVYASVLTAGQVRGLRMSALSTPRVIKWAETGLK